MFGVGILVGLGRRLVAGVLADSGWLPASFYRHLFLAALEEEDFPKALQWLQFAEDPLLAQVLVLRLRLLAARHEKQRQTVVKLLESPLSDELRRRYQTLVAEEQGAIGLLRDYERQALKIFRQGRAAADPQQPA